MKIPDMKHIFSKGILALRKGISLATRGIIDQKIGGKERVIVTLFIEKLFKIKGIKSFEFELVYIIQGNKSNKFKSIFALSGKRTTPIEDQYLVKALLERQLTNITELIGRKEFDTAQEIDLIGKKRFELSEDLDMVGRKRFGFDLDRPLIAKKLFNVVENRNLVGCKKINLDDKILIKGKRDMTNILVALDMLDI